MSLSSIDAKLGILRTILTHSTTYPYAVGSLDVREISISNNATSGKLTVTITLKSDSSTVAIPVEAGKNFSSRVYPISSITTSGANTDFEIALFERG